ncbi:MAG: electron transfer flavoprotein subunit alpha/FixB family protein [Planctomycetes bacterium]|nr:electron transfer flavoprotein subunit alpha/FixB family protein [Planctomycetota bacterium]
MIRVLACTNPDGNWTAVTLELLGDAVVLAQRLATTVGAWVLTTPGRSPSLDELARHGCHAVWRLRSERIAAWSPESIAAALAMTMTTDCRILLLPGGARGEEVAALLAELVDGEWIADVLTLAATRSGAIEITAAHPGGKLARVHRPANDQPVVITIRPGVAEARRNDRPTSLEIHDIDVDLSHVPELTRVEQLLPADPRSVDIVHAQRIVAGGRGVGTFEGMRLIDRFAEALSASPAASRMAVDLGWAPSHRQVGQTGRTVRPDLYVACGISGASHHLAGMRQSKHIVAINPDRSAPVHQIAHLSLFGDLHDLIPAIESALKRRLPG